MFPILRSILSAEALVPVLQTAYGLDVLNLRLIKAVMLDTYQVFTNQGDFIFRIYPHRLRNEIIVHGELDFLQFLHSHQVPVSIPLPTKAGELLLSLAAPEGPRLAALFSFAPGRPLSQVFSDENVLTYGRLLATIHQLTQTAAKTWSRPALDFDSLVTTPLAQLQNTVPERKEDWAFLQEIAAGLQRQLDLLGMEPPVYCMCHGDAGSGNVHITAEGQLTFFDFDLCGPGWRAYDIGTFLIGESEQTRLAFLKGYQKVSKLQPAEIDRLPVFQIMQNIWLLGTRASYLNEWGAIHFTERFVNHVLQTIRETFAQLALE